MGVVCGLLSAVLVASAGDASSHGGFLVFGDTVGCLLGK